ncbi:transcriptional regulator [[Pantoea] beijingensis]|uniref:Transcriptional regulator n=1 Tax=[Pantoea] beijingensis TaxID=1324864 RepID=A0A443I9Z5_9GAMM|nr:LysR family transcriptional regulator [[Pantoea] beijingensis]RWR00942.1 transcriptional regulator [[Pantoea] beijingensis]
MKKVTNHDLAIVLTIATHLNMSRAAVELGVTPSALSHALRNIEERLGLRLFNRTTRSIALTDAGNRLFTRLKPAFRDIDDALEDLNQFRDTPSGTLRINAGRPATQIVLLPLISEFIAQYPQVDVEIDANNTRVDVVSEGFDAGVRFGETVDADMVAIPIGGYMRSAVVATPAFFTRYPVPLHPKDLLGIPCVRLRFSNGSLYRWEFEKEGVKLDNEVNGPITLNDMGLTVEAALYGGGIAYAFEKLVTAPLADGRLVRVLEDWCPSYPGLYLYYPSRRQLPTVLKAFVDFIRERRL